MNDNLPDWYDRWKLDNGETDTCQCYYCEEEYPHEDIQEDSKRNNICTSCSEGSDKCGSCGVAIVDSDYGVTDYDNNPICDACADKAIDPYPDRIYPTADND